MALLLYLLLLSLRLCSPQSSWCKILGCQMFGDLTLLDKEQFDFSACSEEPVMNPSVVEKEVLSFLFLCHLFPTLGPGG